MNENRDNNNTTHVSDEELSRRLREKRIHNFSLNISEEELGDTQSEEEPASLNSYSDPSVAREQSAQASKSEKQAKKRAARAHEERNREKRKSNRRFSAPCGLLWSF